MRWRRFMRIKLVFLERGMETYFGIKPENSDLYFCATTDGNNKTSHLLKHLTDIGSWISTDGALEGIITKERWLDVEGEAEDWLKKKVEEFEFLINYNKPNNNGYYGTNS